MCTTITVAAPPMKISTLEPREYRLASTKLFHTPGIIRWAINGYKFKKDRKAMLKVLGAWEELPMEAAHKLLSGEVSYEVEPCPNGGTVVFTA